MAQDDPRPDWDALERLYEKLDEDSLRILAVRSSLRVLPNSNNTEAWNDRPTRNLALATFRANFISWAARRYPAHDMIVAYSAAYSAARSAARSVAFSAARSAAFSAAYSAAYSAARFAARSAARSTADSTADSAAYSAALSDAMAAEKSGEKSALFKRPLWRGAGGLSKIIQPQVRAVNALPDFTGRTQSASWNLIMAWWENLEPDTSRSLFGAEKDVVLAMQEGSFWGDDLDDPDPDAVMINVAKLLGWPFAPDDDELAQRPAAYTFTGDGDQIVARPLHDAPFDAELAADFHRELRNKLEQLQKRIERTQAPKRISDTIERLIEALGQSVSDVRPGTLFSRSKALESDASTYAKEEALKEVDPEVVSMMADAVASLEDLIGVYPQLSKLRANVLANKLQSANVEEALAPVAQIVTVARDNPLVGQSAIDALEEAAPDIAATTAQIAETRSPDIRAEAIERRAEAVAGQLMVVRNFVSVAIKLGREKLENLTENQAKELLNALDNGVLDNPNIETRLATVAILLAILPYISPLALLSQPYATLERILRKVLEQILRERDKD